MARRKPQNDERQDSMTPQEQQATEANETTETNDDVTVVSVDLPGGQADGTAELERAVGADEQKPLGLDPGKADEQKPLAEPEADAEPPKDTPPRGRQNQVQLTCPYHKKRLVSNRSEPLFTRYYCPVDGCTYMQKVPRPTIKREMERAQVDEQDFSAR